MTRKDFTELINRMQKESDLDNALNNLGIDLMEYNTHMRYANDILGQHLFSKEGWDWVMWFCYETDFGKRKEMTAHDKNKKPICYDIDSLYDTLIKDKYITKKEVKKAKI